jgi:hypothetical protein
MVYLLSSGKKNHLYNLSNSITNDIMMSWNRLCASATPLDMVKFATKGELILILGLCIIFSIP